MMIRALSLVAVLLLVANSADALKVKNVVISDPTEQRKNASGHRRRLGFTTAGS
jgi:hypothetical protein